MKKVITYGTFDLLHAGHINLLRRAKELGDYLIVVVSTDEFNWEQKHKKCYFSYEERKKLVEAVRYVDLVIPETSWEQKINDVKEYHVDTFAPMCVWGSGPCRPPVRISSPTAARRPCSSRPVFGRCL